MTKRCVLIGTSSFAIPAATALHNSAANCTLLSVVTRPDGRSGRGRVHRRQPLADWADRHNVEVFQPQTSDELKNTMTTQQPDVVVVAAYGRLIHPSILSGVPYGFVNIHPSLLPRWRGPSPVAAAILAGDKETGTSLILLDHEMDHGPIIGQRNIPLSPHIARVELEEQLAKLGAELLQTEMKDYLSGLTAPIPQNDTETTTCPLLSREDGHIDWHEPADAIERLVRAYEGWPGTWTTYSDGKRLKILAARLGKPSTLAPGAIVVGGSELTIACGRGTSLMLDRVQPATKPSMGGSAFLNGHSDVQELV
jgi:methionyl-tRNA formyltransferase